jgi:hypothetical protein
MRLLTNDYVPRAVSHLLDNESKTETLGFSIFYIGAARALKDPVSGANEFLWCVVFASILVGGKLVAKSILEAMEMKLGGGKPAAPAAAPAAEPKAAA